MARLAGGVSHANRGRGLETAIEQANASYLARQIATVQQVAVPTKVVSDRRGGLRTVRERSTVDFVGAWSGRPVAFDAKENRKPSFPLDSVHDHQVEFLKNWETAGGVGFLLIWQEVDQAVYLLPYGDLNRYWRRWRLIGGRASISSAELGQCPRCRPGRGCTVDYLAALDAWLGVPGQGGA